MRPTRLLFDWSQLRPPSGPPPRRTRVVDLTDPSEFLRSVRRTAATEAVLQEAEAALRARYRAAVRAVELAGEVAELGLRTPEALGHVLEARRADGEASTDALAGERVFRELVGGGGGRHRRVQGVWVHESASLDEDALVVYDRHQDSAGRAVVVVAPSELDPGARERYVELRVQGEQTPDEAALGAMAPRTLRLVR